MTLEDNIIKLTTVTLELTKKCEDYVKELSVVKALQEDFIKRQQSNIVYMNHINTPNKSAAGLGKDEAYIKANLNNPDQIAREVLVLSQDKTYEIVLPNSFMDLRSTGRIFLDLVCDLGGDDSAITYVMIFRKIDGKLYPGTEANKAYQIKNVDTSNYFVLKKGRNSLQIDSIYDVKQAGNIVVFNLGVNTLNIGSLSLFIREKI